MIRVFTRCILFADVEKKNELIKETCAASNRKVKFRQCRSVRAKEVANVIAKLVDSRTVRGY